MTLHRRTFVAASVLAALSPFPVFPFASTPGSAVIEAPRFGTWGFDTAGMDRSVKPGDDWARYASGTWLKNTSIPPDRARFGNFDALRELSTVRVARLVESYKPGGTGTSPDQAKVARLYRGFMDEAAAQALDAKPLESRLSAVSAAATKEDLARLMGRAVGGFGSTFFATYVSDDAKNPDYYAATLRQSGLGLGDREMYLDAKFAPQKARYGEYVAQMLALAQWPHANEASERIVALETRIAQAHWTRAESRNRDKTYNPMTPAQLEAQAPGFPWPAYFQAAGIGVADRFVVAQVTAIPKLADVFARADLQTLKDWQAFHTADEIAPLLSKRFVDAHFDFHGKFLNGQPEQRPRWKRGVAFAENMMGDAIGRDYVALYYPPESRAIMDRMVSDLRIALKHRIENLAWMSPETKTQGLAKLAAFNVKIGYPEKWRDYSALDVREGDVVGNAERGARFEWDYRRKRWGQRVDKLEWGMTPQTVNAYYSPVKNEIVFPAAILQPPFFDPKADPAVNYGAIGAVIGHEISHGFDDQGRKSDGHGMLRDWWTPADAARYEAEAQKFGAQYEAYEFPQLPGMHINGRASMGENIGDLAGVLIAYDAYRNFMSGKEAPVIDGFTGEQRFFLGYAQIWRSLIRDDALRQQLATDPHSPESVRTVAPLRNDDAWYAAFDVKPGEKLYLAPAARVRIW